MMRFLILSCNTGGGHNAASYAMKEAIEKAGHEAVVLDYMCLAGEGVSKAVGNGYVKTVQIAPKLFGLVYRLGMVVSKLVKRSPVYYANARMAKYIEEYLSENHFDALIVPHLYPGETITYMKQNGMKVPMSFVIITDYTCSPFWEETDCDYYIVPGESVGRQFIKRGVPEDKVVSIGIPVSQKFIKKITKAEARDELKLPMDKTIHLFVGGSMGAGSLKRLSQRIKRLTHGKDEIVIICGSNERMYNKISCRYSKYPQIHVVGQTDRMYMYMFACDIIYTKPGGLTSTEAAAANIPIVHTKPIPGCETENRKYFEKLGMSISSETVLGQVLAGEMLLASESRLKEMREAQSKYINPHAADDIYDFMAEKLKEAGII